MNMNTNEMYDYEAEDVMLFLKQLEKRRQKITQRGRLSEEEDVELTEIDAEVDFWEEILDGLLFEPEEDDEDPTAAE
jgi:hypothetical protein